MQLKVSESSDESLPSSKQSEDEDDVGDEYYSMVEAGASRWDHTHRADVENGTLCARVAELVELCHHPPREKAATTTTQAFLTLLVFFC